MVATLALVFIARRFERIQVSFLSHPLWYPVTAAWRNKYRLRKDHGMGEVFITANLPSQDELNILRIHTPHQCMSVLMGGIV